MKEQEFRWVGDFIFSLLFFNFVKISTRRHDYYYILIQKKNDQTKYSLLISTKIQTEYFSEISSFQLLILDK